MGAVRIGLGDNAVVNGWRWMNAFFEGFVIHEHWTPFFVALVNSRTQLLAKLHLNCAGGWNGWSLSGRTRFV